MCELFGLSASEPVKIRYNLDSFAAEGGERNQNLDGWGIVFTEGRDAHYFREAAPASDSPLDRFVRSHAGPHANVMAHVRRASQGKRALENTHPFRRVRCGRLSHFAHNGRLDGIEQFSGAETLTPQRVGDTDSELAFLLLLERMEQDAPDASDIQARFGVFEIFCNDMTALGPANFLWLDGDNLFVHADRRMYETPEGLTAPQPPGLHMLHPEPGALGDRHDCAGATLEDLPGHMAIFASVPLSDAPWEPLEQGTTLAISAGKILYREQRIASGRS